MASEHDRRTFLGASMAAMALGGLRGAAEAARTFKLALGQWSFHRALRAGALDNLDFAARAKELGFEGVDYVNSFFKDKVSDSTYLREMKRRSTDAGIVNVLVLLDAEGAIGDPDPAKRKGALENHERWVEAAKRLGCRGVRINAQSDGPPEQQRRLCAEGARALTELAAGHDVDVLIENHGGLSSDAAWLVSLVKEVAHPRCGTLPDFGNWDLGGGRWYDRYQGVAELVPLAKAVSVKSHEFDANGDETGTDYARMMKLVIDGGYRGEYLEIEYEGETLGEAEGVRATKKLVERVLAAL